MCVCGRGGGGGYVCVGGDGMGGAFVGVGAGKFCENSYLAGKHMKH